MAIRICLDALLGARRMRASTLARITGISTNALSDLYNENVKGIKFDTLEKICRALKCEPGDLLKLEDDDKNLSSKT